MLDTIDEISSPDFLLHIRMNGKLEAPPRRAAVKETFKELLREAKYEETLLNFQESPNLEHLPSASFSHRDWTVTGHLIPVSPEHRGKTTRFVGFVSIGGTNIDDIGKTKKSLYDKANRYKNVGNLIIALRCDVSNTRLDEVLFGNQQITIYVRNDQTDTTPLPETRHGQKLNGFWFNYSGPINRHVVGVVALFGIHPSTLGMTKAVFYSNPYLDTHLPAWTKVISHAEYSDGEVSIVEGVPPHTFLRDYEATGDPWG